MWTWNRASGCRRWNPTAEDCYRRGCVCEGCYIYELYFKPYGAKCQMKYAVMELVRKFGIPDKLNKEEIICQKNTFHTI